MAIDEIRGPTTPDKMMQIQNVQKAILSGNIFDVPKSDKDSSTIHSGHFMVSRVHEEKEDDDDEEVPIFNDDSKDFSTSMGYDFVQANRATYNTYNFGPKSTSTLSIDASLTKLFECMTLAYRCVLNVMFLKHVSFLPYLSAVKYATGRLQGRGGGGIDKRIDTWWVVVLLSALDDLPCACVRRWLSRLDVTLTGQFW